MKAGVVFDIETKPNPDLAEILQVDVKIDDLSVMADDDMLVYADREEIKLGNRKDPEKIRAHLIAETHKVVDRGALLPFGAEIVAIGAALTIEDEPVASWVRSDEHSESDCIEAFFDRFAIEIRSGAPWVGFNLRGFDLPLIRARCAVLGVRLPSSFPRDTSRDKYDREHIYDIQDVLGLRGTLDNWLRVFGLPGKRSSGAAVASMTHEELHEYVCEDVHLTRSLYHRLQ